MGHDLATKAELVKLARALNTTTDRVGFAKSLNHDDIRRLRESVVAALYDEHRTVFRRIAAITRLLPTSANVRITLRAFPPLLAARIASEMAPSRAAELINRMPVDYLADGCVHLDPRRAAPLVSRVQPDRILAVVKELVARSEYIALGHLLDTASERIVRDVAAAIPDEALLKIGFYAESNSQLTRAVTALPPDRLRQVVHCALTGPPELQSAGLSLIGRLDDDRLRGRLADYAAEADDQSLTNLLHTAIKVGAVNELLAAVGAMGEEAQRRVLALPALTEHNTLTHLIHVTTSQRQQNTR